MATKLFLRNAADNGIGNFYDMVTTAGSSSTTGVVNTTASGTEIQWTRTAGGTVLEFISGRVPSGGFTLSGTMSFSIWAHESNMSANAGARARVFKRTSGGSETEVGGGPYNDGVEFSAPNTAEMTWTGTPTSTAFAEDDRIIVRYYITNAGGTMASGYTCTITYNAADAATGDSFFQINENVTFKPEGETYTVAATVNSYLQRAYPLTVTSGATLSKLDVLRTVNLSTLLEKQQELRTASANADIRKGYLRAWGDTSYTWAEYVSAWDSFTFLQETSADAYLTAGASQLLTLVINAQLYATTVQTSTVSAVTLLQKAEALLATTNALIEKQGGLKTAAAQALLQQVTSLTVAANAALVLRVPLTFSAEALLEKVVVVTAAADAILLGNSTERVVNTNALLQKLVAMSLSMGALLQKNEAVMASGDALLGREGVVVSAQLDSLKQKSFNVSMQIAALLQRAMGVQLSATASLQKGYTLSSLADAIAMLRFSQTVAAEALFQKTVPRQTVIDVWLTKSGWVLLPGSSASWAKDAADTPLWGTATAAATPWEEAPAETDIWTEANTESSTWH